MMLKGMTQTITGDESNGSIGMSLGLGMSTVDIPGEAATRRRVTRGPDSNVTSFPENIDGANGCR